MLKYKRVIAVDDELYQFHLRQKRYYQLEKADITKDSLIDGMQGPEGFEEDKHYIFKGYLNNEIVALVDYQLGYRFSMIHDDQCVWIGLFLIDQDYQNQGLGKKVFNKFFKDFKTCCKRVQLACLTNNITGMIFWKKLGFYEIGSCQYKDLTVIVLEKLI